MPMPGSQVAGAGQSGGRSDRPRGPGNIGLELQGRQAKMSM